MTLGAMTWRVKAPEAGDSVDVRVIRMQRLAWSGGTSENLDTWETWIPGRLCYVDDHVVHVHVYETGEKMALPIDSLDWRFSK